MRIASRSSVYSLLCCLLFAVAPEGVGQTYQGKELVRPELLADTSAAVPGKPFMHATQGEVVPVLSSNPVSPLENVQVVVVGGWQESPADADN